MLTKIIVGSGEENVDQSDLRSKFVLRFYKDGTISYKIAEDISFHLVGSVMFTCVFESHLITALSKMNFKWRSAL